MGVFDRLREGIFRIRAIPGETEQDKTNIVNKKKEITEQIEAAVEAGKTVDLSQLLNITTLSRKRDEKYSIFEEMVADGRIGAALELYANDAVQYNSNGDIVWAESKDNDTYQYVTKLLKDLKIADNIWSWAYCLVLYGDVYLETFLNTSTSGKYPSLLLEPSRLQANVKMQKEIEGGKLERYIEKVANPAELYDLQYRGKTAGFVRARDIDLENNFVDNMYYQYTGNYQDIHLLSPTKFIHLCLSPNINRFPEKFNLVRETEADRKINEDLEDGSNIEGSSTSSLSFTVKTGQSVLENVYGPYQTLKLKEDSVLLERVTKSSITRIIQVELGDMPENQRKAKLRAIKNQIEQQLQVNKETGQIQSRSGAQPTENIIYTTTNNGKGVISSVNIGGDADVGNTQDITDSENKLYGSLLIPKAWLGADMDGTGLSNGGSLTEMSTVYARRVKRIQTALITGIKNLVNIFALAEGVPNIIGNFEIKLTPITTVEDTRRDELLQNKIRNVNDMMSLVSDFDLIDESTKLQIILNWLSDYLNQQDIVNIINKYLAELEQEENEKAEDEATEDENGPDFDFEGGSGPATPNININNEIPDNESPESTSEEPNTPDLETSEEVDLADIEGQDLL